MVTCGISLILTVASTHVVMRTATVVMGRWQQVVGAWHMQALLKQVLFWLHLVLEPAHSEQDSRLSSVVERGATGVRQTLLGKRMLSCAHQQVKPTHM